MKKKIIWILLVLALSVMPVFALQPEDGVQAMARYFPQDVDFFASIRTDEDYLFTLQNLLNEALTKFPPEAGVDPIDFIQLLDDEFAMTNTSYEAIRKWLGDYIAIGAKDVFSEASMAGGQPGEAFDIIIAFAITDAQAFEEFILSAPNFGNMQRIESDGDFIVYRNDREDADYYIGTDVAFLTTINTMPNTADTPRLNQSADYLASLNAMPADNYNMLFYVKTDNIATALMQQGDDAMQELLIDNLPPSVMLGLTILDERALTIDTVQSIAGLELITPSPVNLDSAQYLPHNAQLLAWGRDFTSAFNTLFDQLSDFSTLDGGNRQDLRLPLSTALAMTGIQLEEDFLSWTTGDYILLGGIDTDTILGALVLNVPDFERLPASFGLLMEATDTASAQRFVDKLGLFLNSTLSDMPAPREGDPEISITQTSEGTWALNLAVPLAFGTPPMNITIEMGISDGIFYLATDDIAEVTRGNGATLADDARYQYASQFFLPNPVTILYTNDEGIISTLGFLGLGFLGPVAGSVFDSIQESLQAPSSRHLVSIQTERTQASSEIASMLRMVFDVAKNIVHSTSITATVTGDGYSIARAVFVLE